MYGDDKPLDDLRREVQELKEQMKALQNELFALREMIEDRHQH